MFNFIKQAFIAWLSFSGLLATKYVSLNNAPCLARPILIDLMEVVINTLDDLSSMISVWNKTEDLNLNLFNMVARASESKVLTKHISYGCKWESSVRRCN